jgi:predicted TIM-barrel fold metal-dependent hydrolase
MDYRLVSADGHINEPPDLWTKRAPASLADLVPKVVRTDDGGDAWVLAPNLPPRMMGTSAAAGRRPEEYQVRATYKEMRPGSFDPKARLEDMDIDHVDAEVLYPGQCRALDMFASAEVRLFCAQTYNDWIAEFQSACPERLIGVAVLPPVDDGDDAAARELERAHELGLRAAFLAVPHEGMPLSHPRADSLWEVAGGSGIPISLHIGSSRSHWVGSLVDVFPGVKESMMSTIPMSVAEHIAVLVFSGVMDRFPSLRLVVAESGVGWIPYVLQRMEAVFEKHHHYLNSQLERRPIQVFQEQMVTTFQEDAVGLRLHDLIGPRSMMWASDYPHTDTTWPNSLEVIENEFRGLDNETRERILCRNCVELYRLQAVQA